VYRIRVQRHTAARAGGAPRNRIAAVSRLRFGVLAAVAAAALAGCGSSTPAETTAVPGGAAVQAAATAPAYCTTLTKSKPLVELSTAMDTLAREPGNAAARATVRAAAEAVNSAAIHAPAAQRAALLRAGHAMRSLASHGLAAAGTASSALTHAGRALGGACSFPAG